jgi:hypothetical protein
MTGWGVWGECNSWGSSIAGTAPAPSGQCILFLGCSNVSNAPTSLLSEIEPIRKRSRSRDPAKFLSHPTNTTNPSLLPALHSIVMTMTRVCTFEANPRFSPNGTSITDSLSAPPTLPCVINVVFTDGSLNVHHFHIDRVTISCRQQGCVAVFARQYRSMLRSAIARNVSRLPQGWSRRRKCNI